MANQQQKASFWGGMLALNLYKRNQGRLTRQLTAVGFGLVVFFGLYTLSQGPLANRPGNIKLGVPLVLGLLSGWMLFRLVHYPPFADFLISVQGEMDKVSWASKEELKRSAIVVLVTMFFLGFCLFIYDIFWQAFFRFVGFLRF